MIIKYSPDFFATLKKVDVRIRKSVKTRILLFSKNPHNLRLNNHPLKREWKRYRSIDITNDWRAIYTEKIESDEIIAYFVALGTHTELYK